MATETEGENDGPVQIPIEDEPADNEDIDDATEGGRSVALTMLLLAVVAAAIIYFVVSSGGDDDEEMEPPF